MSADDMRDDRSDLDPAAMPPDRARQVDRDTQRDAKPVADREVARPPADRETSQVETDDRTALFEPTQLSEFKGRWSEIQAGFVDAPQRAVQEADALVADVIARLSPVRGDLTDSGFFTLVRDVVRTKVRFAERDAIEDLMSRELRAESDT